MSTGVVTCHVSRVTAVSMFRIKIDYGSDGSLESRLYVSGAGRGDAGRYSCVMPGLASVQPANINITVTQGEGEIFLIDFILTILTRQVIDMIGNIDSDLQL